MGTKVVMNGIEYTVEDTGNFAQYGVQFDVYYDNHAVAEAHGHQTWECFLAEGNQNSVEVTRTVTADVLNVSVQAKPLRSVILSRMEEDEQEIYEEVYSNRGNLQTMFLPVRPHSPSCHLRMTLFSVLPLISSSPAPSDRI